MKAGVVIVNYNCAALALDAALSALGDDPKAVVVIVDNCSTDASLEYFRRVFADRRAHTPKLPDDGPVPCAFADIGSIECAIADRDTTGLRSAQLTILTAKANGGFAAGCNLGMEYLSKDPDVDWFLLLNPDAVLACGAMNAMLERLSDRHAGLCGASVLRFEDPYEIQALGGARLGRATLLGDNIGWGKSFTGLPANSEVEACLDYPLGAAMALKADYRERYGDLDERYFLYYEEADWAMRGGLEARPVWARDAVVYHRHGAAAGSQIKQGSRGALSEYHMARSRMLFALKWRPWLVPFILALSAAQAVRRLLRGRATQAWAIIAGSVGRHWTVATN